MGRIAKKIYKYVGRPIDKVFVIGAAPSVYGIGPLYRPKKMSYKKGLKKINQMYLRKLRE